MVSVSHLFVPATAGEFHHFIVTRGEHTVSVAYERTNAAREQLTVSVDDAAESAARWNLSPDAHAAFRHQVDAGWRGEVVQPLACVGFGAECAEVVTHIDGAGFTYCAAHGVRRRQHCKCRKLTPAERKRLTRGETIRY